MNSDDEHSGYRSEDPSVLQASYRREPEFPRVSDRASRTSSKIFTTPPSFNTTDMSDGTKRTSQDTPVSLDQISTDPRHLSQTLGSSLVSEIHTLRRELESKTLFIEGIETELAETRTENEGLVDAVSRNARESRIIKKQLQQIETSTLEAIESLAKERDDANQAKEELRKRLDESQKRCKTLEDDAKRAANQHALDQAKWETERRAISHRALVAESRLKSLIVDVATANQTIGEIPATPQSNDQRPQTPENSSPELSRDSVDDDHSRLHNVKLRQHQREQSTSSSFAGSPRKGGRNITGLSLADELAFDEDDEDQMEDVDSPVASIKRLSSEKDGKVPQIVSDFENRAGRTSIDSTRLRMSIDSRREEHLQDANASSSSSKQPLASPPLDDINGANQSRRRAPPTDVPARPLSDIYPQDALLATAATGISATAQLLLPSPTLHVSASTQTEWPEPVLPASPPPPTRAPPPIPAIIPTIAIHAPEHASESGTGTQKLPPNTKSLGCQTDFAETRGPCQSVSTQTEGIRIDTRPVKLPAHLLPSAISDSVGSVFDSNASDRLRSIADTPHTSIETMASREKPSSESWNEITGATVQADETRTTTGNVTSDEGAWARLKKAFRSSQQMLDSPHMLPYDINEGDAEEDLEEDYTTQPIRSSFRASKHGRPAFDPPTPVPEDDRIDLTRSYSRGSASGRASTEEQRLARMTRRRSAAHSKSPSYGSAASSSNFSRKSYGRPPIPPRASSQSRPSRYHVKNGHNERSLDLFSNDAAIKFEDRSTGLRKARSAALIRLENAPSQRGLSSAKSASPIQSYAPGKFPPVPTDSAAYRQHARAGRAKPYIEIYDMMAPTGGASVGATMPVGFVDAITSCMIGEWMWKYVRKRKSFGVIETAKDNDKRAEARHRRWVWLSPYDKTIMWSSKQPTSNAALMGKAGRKLQIQSVHDVPDDTPPPKSAGQDETYSKSISILTPVRALKFTATSCERHHLWMTALSYLVAPQADAVSDLKQSSGFAPPNSPEPMQATAMSSRGALASVRSSMGKSRSSRSSGLISPVSQAFDPNIFDHHRHESREISDAALPPSVPRIPKHMRKRSATNPIVRGRPTLGATTVAAPSSNISTAVSSQPSARHSRAPSLGNHGRIPIQIDQDDFYASEGHFREPSPRPSNVSADFGSNSNFFDAGGLVRMTAFVSPGVTVTASNSNSSSKDFRESGTPLGHRSGKPSQGSVESINAPPPIGRIRRSFKKKDAARRQVFQRRKEEMALEGRHVFSETEI